jgi:uncharacterized protein YmfQ (DUF2313 family)
MFETIKHLLPRGRAWDMTKNKKLREFFEGLGNSFTDFKEFADEVYLDVFPQTTRELDAWEEQLGLDSEGKTTQQRRDDLEARWKNDGNLEASYIQQYLQNEGYMVYVHHSYEDTAVDIPPSIRNPRLYIEDTNGNSITQCNDTDTECGEALMECGETLSPGPVGILLVNKTGVSVNPPIIAPVVPSDPATWPYFMYIGDETFPDVVNIDENERERFESILLKIRPTHLWIGLLVNYS